MKSVLTYGLKFLVAMMVIVLAGCETDRILLTGPYHIRFTQSSDFAKESFNEVIKIEVHLVGSAHDDDITIHYDISGDARENVDYIILGERGEVTIEEDEYFGYIEIQLINNANDILRSQDIIFTLRSVAPGSLEVGQGESQIGKTFTYTILDDCILGDVYTGMENGFAIEGISITSNDCETYVLSNWNIDPNFFGSSIEMDLTFFDNGDNTLTIPEQQEETIVPSQATIMGDGIVNPITRQIILTIVLVDIGEERTITLIPD